MNGWSDVQSLTGKSVILRPVERDDYRVFFAWRSNLSEAHLWTTHGRRVVTFDQFASELEAWLRDSIILLAADITTGDPIGFGRAYNASFVDGTVFAQTFVAPAYRRRAQVSEGGLMFLDYLFRYYPLRKLYAEVAAYNESAERLYTRLGFQREGRLTEHVWFGDRYWDWYIFSLTRDAWAEARERLKIIARVEADLAEPARSASRRDDSQVLV